MEDRQIIEWDKDDIDVLKFMKVDVLGLGMLGCMNRAFNLLKEHKGISVGMADLQDDDPAVYGMIQKADTLGVFQIESRAQMSMLPRMKPKEFYDLVIEEIGRASWRASVCQSVEFYEVAVSLKKTKHKSNAT